MDGVRYICEKDWSSIKDLKNDGLLLCHKNINNISSDNLGIYVSDSGKICSSGYVGVCMLQDIHDNDYVDEYGNRVVLVIRPRFSVSPWDMLTEVLQDKEYNAYMQSVGNELYKVFYDEKPIKMDVEKRGGETLLALSFIRSCYQICVRILNREMGFTAENFNGRIKGRIDLGNQIKRNLSQGREDRIYCKYLSFSEATIENQILKKALICSERALQRNGSLYSEGLESVRSMISYCKNRLKNIPLGNIRESDFSRTKTTGFNYRYNPAIRLAKMILSHSSMNIDSSADESSYVMPYAIKMEVLFELYVRALFKKQIEKAKMLGVKLDEYRSKSGNALNTTAERDTYLMNSYIPDIAIQKYNEQEKKWEYSAVLDVKYQNSTKSELIHAETRRHNTHQLLFYALLLNVKQCGFIFPEEYGKTYARVCREVLLQPGNANGPGRNYSEFHFGSDPDKQEEEIKNIVAYAREE